MTPGSNDGLLSAEWPEIVQKIRAQTPARLLAGRSGAGYRTSTQMELREAHAAARDAVRRELDLTRDLGSELIKQWNLFEVGTRAITKEEYLLRPDLGRQFSDESREKITEHCPTGADLQIAIGDGLSVTAVSAQVPGLLELLHQGARARDWIVGQAFVIRHCRVGILNEIGDLLAPRVAILLIGERPGLATAESLSAYMAYQPKKIHTDADRNLISNIHNRGLNSRESASRILNVAGRMMAMQRSGYQLREELPSLEEKTK